MIEKISFFAGDEERGPAAVPLFTQGPADAFFEKTASSQLLPDVVRYISSLRPRPDAQYVLVNALGAGEYWGSNVNGDFFPEAALIHAPDNWTGVPLIDRVSAKGWPYGYPTFYEAKPFAHHRNKDATKGFGDVELAVWHDRMKRVELVCRLDAEKCHAFGGTGIWDRLKAGQFVDVSMGCRVPFDTCSICLDWGLFRKAQNTFDPKKHKYPGEAILSFHRAKKAKDGVGIRGLSITRADYCEHARDMMNKILPDGRKVFVYNDYPRFFDISFVFIGADRTAKTMLKIASETGRVWSFSSNSLEEPTWEQRSPGEKLAAISDVALANAFGKTAKLKRGEIVKDVIPSQFAAKAVPVVAGQEPDLPSDILNALGQRPLEEALSSLACLGITLRPREFQRVVLVCSGNLPLADDFDRRHIVFAKNEGPQEPAPIAFGEVNGALMRLLLPFLETRSVFGPPIERRTLHILLHTPASENLSSARAASSLSSELLRKISSAYNMYRQALMTKVAEAQETILGAGLPSQELASLARLPADKLFTPMSAAHLKFAYWNELGTPENGKAQRAGVERGFPSKNTFRDDVHF